MYYDVTDVRPLEGRRIWLRFEDGSEGVFDTGPCLGMPAFASLGSDAVFRRAFVDEGTVAWPGGVDIAPERLWSDCDRG